MDKDGACYCGKERNLNVCELLCGSCQRWFHENCISYQVGKLVPFMCNYTFTCKNCSQTALESFKKTQATFPQICLTAISNLMQTSVKEGGCRKMFNREKEIIPFIENHWESMTTMPRRVTQSWHATILRALTKETGTLFKADERSDGTCYGLLSMEVTQVRPPYDGMSKAGVKQQDGAQIINALTETIAAEEVFKKFKKALISFLHDNSFCSLGEYLPLPVTGAKGRAKRRLNINLDANQMKKGRGVASDIMTKLPSHGYPMEHPHNKDGYRYILAEPDPNAPFRQEFDESADWAGKPIPPWLYRAVIPGSVLLALHDRATQIKVSDDRLTAIGEKGYSMLRCTHAVSRGTWYWEAQIVDLPEGGAARIGWAQEYANLQAPVGYDKFGYSWRSRKGTKFHESIGKHYSDGYTLGDILGFLIELPDIPGKSYLPQTYKKDRPLVKFKSHLYYEEKDNVSDALKGLKPLKGAKITFFKNGECQGVAFEDIYAGTYFPSISLYKSTAVQVNFGPTFSHKPDLPCRGVWEKAEEAIVEQTIADMGFLTENHGKLKLDL